MSPHKVTASCLPSPHMWHYGRFQPGLVIFNARNQLFSPRHNKLHSLDHLVISFFHQLISRNQCTCVSQVAPAVFTSWLRTRTPGLVLSDNCKVRRRMYGSTRTLAIQESLYLHTFRLQVCFQREKSLFLERIMYMSDNLIDVDHWTEHVLTMTQILYKLFRFAPLASDILS